MRTSSLYCGCGLPADHESDCLPDFIQKPGPWNPQKPDGSWRPFDRGASQQGARPESTESVSDPDADHTRHLYGDLDSLPCGPLGYSPIEAVEGMAARMREFHAETRHGSVMILTIGRDRCASYWLAMEHAAHALRTLQHGTEARAVLDLLRQTIEAQMAGDGHHERYTAALGLVLTEIERLGSGPA